ncbi:metalloregulator ArsR/SmtB family transcription factor [Pseudolysinimonas kribbensis]|uniref:HTH-type transcriptional regulator YczG n=1 Tax=Pseudolysinimonas kribbensis TaxID=433641 RepID=A0ABQ6K7T5_9MICO|nr:metalloregulator ArsR/SmtB family transcription factor [Pseudolysinimonas kribbensis]GMA96732.1 putative HTH-type transcriptional regulator YczG [Pseudolysinimonas kribbensis]
MGDDAPHLPPDPPAAEDMQLTDVLQAMADPNRLQMLTVLGDDQWHSCGLDNWGLDLQKSTVSHHLRTLREAGLVEYRLRGRNKDARLRRDIVESRFPGLLDGVLNSA